MKEIDEKEIYDFGELILEKLVKLTEAVERKADEYFDNVSASLELWTKNLDNKLFLLVRIKDLVSALPAVRNELLNIITKTKYCKSK